MEFVIILGSSIPVIQQLRVKKGVEYFSSINRHVNGDLQVVIPRTMLVFSGGGHSQPPEANNILEYALSLGVSPDDCIVENQSMNTVENILFSLKRIKELGYLKPAFNMGITFTICTSEFHLRRATLIAISNLSPFGKVQSLGADNGDISEETKRNDIIGTFAYINQLLGQRRVFSEGVE